MILKKKLLENIISYLIVIIPIALITGPFISDLIIFIINIIFLLYCFIKNDLKIFKNIYFKYFLIFYFICIISALLSDYKSISLVKSIFYIRFAVFSLAFYTILKIKKKLPEYLFISFMLCFSLLIFDGIYQYIFDVNIVGYKIQEYYRVSSFFKDELIYGSYLSRLQPILFALFFVVNFSNRKFLKFYFFLLMVLTCISIMISGERASFAFLIMTSTYLMLMLKINTKYLMASFLTVLLTIILFISFNSTVKYRLIDFTSEQVGLTAGDLTFFSKEHTGHYFAAIDIFKSNKIIGIGPKNFRNYCYNNKKYSIKPFICSSHPHNTYIQLLTETGIAGFITIFIIFLLITYFSIKHLYGKIINKVYYFNNHEICLIAAMLISVWPLITTGSFFNNYLNIIYFFPIGIFLSSKYKQNLPTKFFEK